MVNEFKEFALRGNVVDMAVGIIIGAAFSTIVKSLVDDVIMPPIGLVTGGVDFSNLFIALDGESYASLAAARDAGAPTVNYGLFINSVISFAIVAFVLFLLIKGMNHLRREQDKAPEEEKPAPPPRDIQLLEEIRDALVEGKQQQ
ncbi:MAG: large conductance mechanosensitive channel protein MscL [Methyloligella sp. ZOD6]